MSQFKQYNPPPSPQGPPSILLPLILMLSFVALMYILLDWTWRWYRMEKSVAVTKKKHRHHHKRKDSSSDSSSSSSSED
jgi:FtsZ-interacting cell division protein ZipA